MLGSGKWTLDVEVEMSLCGFEAQPVTHLFTRPLAFPARGRSVFSGPKEV